MLRDFLHQQYQWSYGPLPIPKNPGSPCQMMSKGCIITETKRKVFRCHDTILSLGEPGSLGWRFGALPTTGFSMVHFAPGFFFSNLPSLGSTIGSIWAIDLAAATMSRQMPFFRPGWREEKKWRSLFRNSPFISHVHDCSWPFGRRTVRYFLGTFHRTIWLLTTYPWTRHLDDLPKGVNP